MGSTCVRVIYCIYIHRYIYILYTILDIGLKDMFNSTLKICLIVQSVVSVGSLLMWARSKGSNSFKWALQSLKRDLISLKWALHSFDTDLHSLKRALYSLKRDLHSLNRFLHSLKRALHAFRRAEEEFSNVSSLRNVQ